MGLLFWSSPINCHVQGRVSCAISGGQPSPRSLEACRPNFLAATESTSTNLNRSPHLASIPSFSFFRSDSGPHDASLEADEGTEARLSSNFFLIALGLGTATEIGLVLSTSFSLGAGFMVTILVPLLIAISLAFSSTSGVVSALNSVDSFAAGVVRDIQSWVSGTSASADVKLPSRYNRLASLFSAVAALAVLPFSIGLLAKDLGYAGSTASFAR